MKKAGLRPGMEGEVVRCFRDSVDVYCKDLGRVVHFMDFHMRTSLKRMPEVAAKTEIRPPRKKIRVIAWVALITAITMISVYLSRSEFPELKFLQGCAKHEKNRLMRD